jgi:dihydroneopterin aldolase
MIVEIRGLEVFGRHGVSDDERRDGQTFLFDITVDVAEPNDDSIDATVDYRRIRDIVRRVSEDNTFQLLESFAARVAEEIDDQVAANRVRVRVRKPGIEWAEWTGITCERP